ncbi:hypothetical protein H7R52_01705 [Weissella confusa]|uniref:Uncharacterized protein n=1 Tax=Weissella confusa TaxID=1583 RepID=A0A923SMN1_WEICO|nr:hypothetical protein [Weissella confusa]
MIDKSVATLPAIPAAIMTGTNNKGLRNILATWEIAKRRKAAVAVTV